MTPRQPATYLFRITKRESGRGTAGKLRLAVEYRALQDDAVGAAARVLDGVCRRGAGKASRRVKGRGGYWRKHWWRTCESAWICLHSPSRVK